ncbi:hypothetical protein [Sulfurospirillum arcachonense]|nr:hypothetical protein [Sulfurospirillum arcachonense]
MKIIFICFILLTSLFSKNINYGNAIVSEVTSIYDGDTFKVDIKE